MPNAIPDELEVDISGMELGDSLHISDLPIPEGTEIVTEDSLTVATVLVPRGLKDGEGEVAPAEAEEGADAPADDAAAAGGDDS